MNNIKRLLPWVGILCIFIIGVTIVTWRQISHLQKCDDIVYIPTIIDHGLGYVVLNADGGTFLPIGLSYRLKAPDYRFELIQANDERAVFTIYDRNRLLSPTGPYGYKCIQEIDYDETHFTGRNVPLGSFLFDISSEWEVKQYIETVELSPPSFTIKLPALDDYSELVVLERETIPMLYNLTIRVTQYQSEEEATNAFRTNKDFYGRMWRVDPIELESLLLDYVAFCRNDLNTCAYYGVYKDKLLYISLGQTQGNWEYFDMLKQDFQYFVNLIIKNVSRINKFNITK